MLCRGTITFVIRKKGDKKDGKSISQKIKQKASGLSKGDVSAGRFPTRCLVGVFAMNSQLTSPKRNHGVVTRQVHDAPDHGAPAAATERDSGGRAREGEDANERSLRHTAGSAGGDGGAEEGGDRGRGDDSHTCFYLCIYVKMWVAWRRVRKWGNAMGGDGWGAGMGEALFFWLKASPNYRTETKEDLSQHPLLIWHRSIGSPQPKARIILKLNKKLYYPSAFIRPV